MDDLGVGFALGFFHDKAHDRADRAFFAAFVFFHGFGHFRDRFVAPFFDGGGVSYLT